MLKINSIALFLGAALWAVSFSCTSSTSNEQQTEEKQESLSEIRVLAYNIHHCNPPSEAGKIDVEAIAEVISRQNPDLVALQEVDVMTARSGKIDEAKMLADLLDMNYYFAKAIDHDGGEYGIAILSRFPISETKTYALPSEESSGGEPRVLATAKVALADGKFIRFASTHLDAQKEDTNRLLQIQNIAEIAATEALPMIIGGDFNAPVQSEVIEILGQSFTKTCENCPPTIPVINPTKAIDFIAFRPQNTFSVLQHEVISETYVSDHLPVFTVLQMH